MEKLETPKKKHDHKATKILKFSIFAFVMLAPFISVISKVAYVSFNKNAKDSYYGETINEQSTQDVSFNNFVVGQTYSVQYTPITYTVSSGTTYINVTNLIVGAEPRPNITIIRYISYNNNYLVDLYESGNNQIISEYNITTSNLKLTFTYQGKSGANLYNEFDKFYTIVYNRYSYLDNAMSYGINELQNDNLYNWSKNTGIYNAILEMTNGLGANDTIAMLLAYWSIITAIYIVFDIVIELFIKLTHLLN